MKKIISIILTVVLLTLCLFSCGETDNSDATKISFKSASTYSYLKQLDNQKVTINGYMATSSPVDGSFMFLMNLPYQSCPFCVPNTDRLSNTIEVYPKGGDSFPYTNQAISVVGTLVVAPSEDEYFEDMYSYQFNFKIVDATYTILSSDQIGMDIITWNRIAESDIINDIYKMYDYVNFLTDWEDYYIKSHYNSQGEYVKGYYLHPQDAYYYVTTKGAQWNYGFEDGYFDSLVSRLESIDKEATKDLVENIRNAEALANRSFEELLYSYDAINKELDDDPTNDIEPNYTKEWKYLEDFDNYDYVFKLNKGEELRSELNVVYTEFSNWLSSWEM
ncbi:MAG: hypothetical protein IKB27_06135 [Clostridia bacterium]|nr:hypothetical protein [Clostridia bacterium]